MEILSSNYDLESFYERLRSSRNRLLMLDYDGTLAPFTTERHKAVPYPEITDTLERLFVSDRLRLVIITGRTVDDMKTLLTTKHVPEIWGCHGLERHTRDGQYSIVELPEETRHKLAELYNWIALNNLVNFFEFKPSGGAFHWRGLPEDEGTEIRRKVVEDWKAVADTTSLELFEFDGGIEVRVSGTHKGEPVGSLLEEAGDDALAAYLGDDNTDEDGFKAIKGKGLGVLVRELPKDTLADIRITAPDELRTFLGRWL